MIVVRRGYLAGHGSLSWTRSREQRRFNLLMPTPTTSTPIHSLSDAPRTSRHSYPIAQTHPRSRSKVAVIPASLKSSLQFISPSFPSILLVCVKDSLYTYNKSVRIQERRGGRGLTCTRSPPDARRARQAVHISCISLAREAEKDRRTYPWLESSWLVPSRRQCPLRSTHSRLPLLRPHYIRSLSLLRANVSTHHHQHHPRTP